MANSPPTANCAAPPDQSGLSSDTGQISGNREQNSDVTTNPGAPAAVYLSATEGQCQLLLDGLNDDVLAIIVDFLFDMDKLNDQYFFLYTNPGPYFRTHRSTLNLSVTNKRLRAVCTHKLFKDIHRCSSSMGQLNRQLKDIELNVQLLSSVRTCEIVMSSPHDSTLCKTRLPKVLAAMPCLQELSITYRKHVDFSALDATFLREKVVLPSVVGLRIQCPGEWNFLVEACPNTETLILSNNLYCEGLMEAVHDLKKLRHLEFFDKGWSESDINNIYHWVPYIESLTLKGGIDGGHVERWAKAFGQFTRLRTLAITTDPLQLDCDFEAAFSDDSDVAMSIINSRRSHGVDIDFDAMALSYFTEARSMTTLYLWEFGSPIGYSFSVTRKKDGSPASVHPTRGNEEEGDDDSWVRLYDTVDRDGFPRKLSFPSETMSYDAKYDPPTYGRPTLAEREEKKALQEEKSWYTERWARWSSLNR